MKFGSIKTNLIFIPFAAMLAAAPLSGDEKPAEALPAKDGYTINYNTLSIVEYIRFASKICGVNFIFNESDLNFNITVVSEGPITSQNVMATLVQVLRIHGLTLLEQDNNLVIHKSEDVKQIAKLVVEGASSGNAPIVTRLFRIKSNKPESIAAIIRPMISKESILDISPETRQLILTDVTANVDKVAALIENLDTPHTKIEIRTYEVKYNSPDFLINMASQIMDPIAQGNPFIMVPQPLANTIHIVSTPELDEKAISVLSGLDMPAKKSVLSARKLKSENIFVYKVEYASADDVLKGLKGISTNLQQSGIPDSDLVEAIENAKTIHETNSIMFLASRESIEKLKEFLIALDVKTKTGAVPSSFFIFKPQNRSAQDVQSAILEMAHNLKGTKGADEAVIQTIESAKVNPLTNTLSFSGEEQTFVRVKELLATVDMPGKVAKIATKNNFYLYKIQQAPADEIETSLKNFAKSLEKSNANEDGIVESIQEMKYVKESNSLLFTGSDAALRRLQDILPAFDKGIRAPPPTSTQFYIYKPRFQKGEQLLTSIKDLGENLRSSNLIDPGFLRSLQSVKWAKSTNSLLFTGDPDSLKKIEDLMSTLDIPQIVKPGSEKTFFLYSPQFASKDKTQAYLKEVSNNLNKQVDASLIDTIDSMKWIEPSHSFMFNGSASSIAKLQELLKNFDTPQVAAPKQMTNNKTFFLYPLEYVSQEKAETYLKQVRTNLNKQTEGDLIDAIDSMKWIEPSHSFMFNGTPAAISRIQDLLKNFDTSSRAAPPSVQKNFYLYKLQHSTFERTEQYIDQLAQSLEKKGTDPELVETLKSRKWIQESHSILFSGTDASLAKVKDILSSYDTQAEQAAPQQKPGYFIYKLQNTTGDVIEEDLESLSKNLKQSGMADSKLVKVIDNMRYVKETNSILLTGDPNAIEEVKDLIAKYDFARPTVATPANNNFYLYKPQFVKAPEIEKSLRDIGANLKKANLADPNLLAAIDSMKYVESTNSIIFTGTADALQKIQVLIKDIDVPVHKHAPIQHVGKTTFLLYKLQHASGTQIVTSIKAIASDLKKSGTSDKDFLAALNSMKYVRETNSLLFTGTEEALTKTQSLVEKFDVTSLAAPVPKAPEPVAPTPQGPGSFFVYKTQSLSGMELEKLLQDFAENLKSSGLYDPDLFNTINSVRWVEKTQSLVFTGTEKSLDQVKELLKSFDIPANLAEGPPLPGSGVQAESSIQAIDNTSFLVYKLQFHKGDEIQGALRQIAKDLIISNAPVNQNLLNSINSIQWLEVTNSLLCSGDQETLTRLRELVKNLDIPLKQVFIEMLVISTTMNNSLSFGLEWGGKYKYRDKFSGSINNLIPPSSATGVTNTGSLDSFSQAVNNINPSGVMTTTNTTGASNNATVTSPTPQLIPFSANGFDLGIIGEVIRHNGNTFLTLGSLLEALQTESETSVIMNPKLITQDSKTSSIFIGQNIPFAGSFVSNQGTNVVNTSNIEYRDIGMSLTVTPVLGNSDIVTLDIAFDQSATISGQTGTISTSSNGSTTLTGITTSKTSMQTTVHVPDQNFLILSGMVNATDNKNSTGLPCLGGLPLIGAAFSQSNSTYNDSNIVIFIRPHILNSLDDMKKISKAQEDFFREQTGSPFLEHNFEEGMEWIKTVDDE